MVKPVPDSTMYNLTPRPEPRTAADAAERERATRLVADASARMDAVEISRDAAEPQPRADLVARIRQEIRDGTYETPDKLQTAVGRLIAALRSEAAPA